MAGATLGAAGFEARVNAARTARTERYNKRLQWFGDQIQRGVKIGMRTRVRVAGQLVRDKVVINLSFPVKKAKSGRTGRVIVIPGSRSKPGEFPRADTTRLMKDIFYDVTEAGQQITAVVGTTLNYGLFLETRMNRSFLLRTLNEVLPQLHLVLLQGKGAGGQMTIFR